MISKFPLDNLSNGAYSHNYNIKDQSQGYQWGGSWEKGEFFTYLYDSQKCRCKKSQFNGRCACCNSKTNCTSFCECENCCNPFAKEAQEPVEDTDSEEEMEQEELKELNNGSKIEEADDDVY